LRSFLLFSNVKSNSFLIRIFIVYLQNQIHGKPLTQKQFGVLLGVQKSQISKIENNAKDVRFSTILRAFEALKAQVHLTVEFPGKWRVMKCWSFRRY